MSDYTEINEFFYNNIVNAVSDSDKMFWRSRLIENNISLAIKYCNEFASTFGLESFEYDDLLQCAYLGLMNAVDHWDINKGSFSTIVYYYVRQSMQRNIAKYDKMIYIPHETFRQYKDFLNCSTSDKTLQDFCKEKKLQVDKFVNLGCFDNISYTEDIESINTEYNTVFNQIFNNTIESTVKEALDTLTFKQRRAIELYFGFDGIRDRTLDDVGKIIGASRQNVNQLINNGLTKLRNNKSLQDLL